MVYYYPGNGILSVVTPRLMAALAESIRCYMALPVTKGKYINAMVPWIRSFLNQYRFRVPAIITG